MCILIDRARSEVKGASSSFFFSPCRCSPTTMARSSAAVFLSRNATLRKALSARSKPRKQRFRRAQAFRAIRSAPKAPKGAEFGEPKGEKRFSFPLATTKKQSRVSEEENCQSSLSSCSSRLPCVSSPLKRERKKGTRACRDRGWRTKCSSRKKSTRTRFRKKKKCRSQVLERGGDEEKCRLDALVGFVTVFLSTFALHHRISRQVSSSSDPPS